MALLHNMYANIHNAMPDANSRAKKLLGLCIADNKEDDKEDNTITPRQLIAAGCLKKDDLEDNKQAIIDAMRTTQEVTNEAIQQENISTQAKQIDEYETLEHSLTKQHGFIEKTALLLQKKESLLGKKCYHPIAQHDLEQKNKSLRFFTIQELHEEIVHMLDALEIDILGPGFGEALITTLMKKRAFTANEQYHLGWALDSSGDLCAVVKKMSGGTGNCYIHISNDAEIIAMILKEIRPK